MIDRDHDLPVSSKEWFSIITMTTCSILDIARPFLADTLNIDVGIELQFRSKAKDTG